MRKTDDRNAGTADPADYVYGRWPVREALEAGPVSKILIARGTGGQPIDEIVHLARSKNVPFLWVERHKLDRLVSGNHQGVVALAAPVGLAAYSDLLERVRERETRGPSLLFLDGIEDPQNLGAILRSAVFFGVPGVVIPKWRASSVTGSVVRASAGAARHVPIAQVSNLAESIERAREAGLWIVGADMDGEEAKKADIPRPFALVMGSEGSGMHQLVRKKCDFVVKLSGASDRPGVGSLNVGAACAALLYQFC